MTADGLGALIEVGRGASGAALRHHIAGTSFTATALCGDAEFKLDFVKTHAGTGVTRNFTVRDSAADTDDHEGPWQVG